MQHYFYSVHYTISSLLFSVKSSIVHFIEY